MYKKIILFLIAISMGNITLMLLEKTSLNIWLVRSVGCLVVALSIIVLYKLFTKEKISE